MFTLSRIIHGANKIIFLVIFMNNRHEGVMEAVTPSPLCICCDIQQLFFSLFDHVLIRKAVN